MKSHEAVEVICKQLINGELRKSMQKEKVSVLLKANVDVLNAKQTIKELKEAKDKLDPESDKHQEIVKEIDKTINLYESKIKEIQNARKCMS